jgi:glycosyltransferase involved in cell wall biosynthesis
MKRILLTVHKFFPEHKAGTELLTLKVAQELMRRSYEVLVVTANPPDRDARHATGQPSNDYVYEDVPVHVLGESLRLEGYTFDHEFKHPAIARHFREVLERFAPDLLHVFHAQNLSASIIDCAVEKNIPVVCSGTDFWFVCPIVQLKRPDGSVCRGPSLAASNCLTCYTPHLVPAKGEFVEQLKKKYPVLSGPLNGAPAPVAGLVENLLMSAWVSAKLFSAVRSTVKRPNTLRQAANKTKAIMVPTQLMRDIFVENGIHPELIRHVPFGIDTEPLVPFQQKTESAVIRFGFIGTLFEHKGPDLLLKAFQKLPPDCRAELKIYGDLEQFPGYGNRLKALVEANPQNREKIKFPGTFPNADLGSVLQNMDVLVVPSRWYENTPLVIQSALASKTPLIVTNLGGMAELVRHGFNGLVFDLNNVDSLCEQMKRFLDEADLLETLRENIAPERTIPQMVDDIEAVYAEVLDGNGGPPAQK